MLEMLTVPDGVAVDGLKKVLKFLTRNYPAISQQLKTDNKLAIKIVYLLDWELQRFFCILDDAADDMSLMEEDDECYLHYTVKTWLPQIETGSIPSVNLPKILGGQSSFGASVAMLARSRWVCGRYCGTGVLEAEARQDSNERSGGVGANNFSSVLHTVLVDYSRPICICATSAHKVLL
jgi:hypothetical protein